MGPIANIPIVTVEKLKKIVDEGRDILVIDVRTEQEFIDNHLPFVNDLIPHDRIEQYWDKIPNDKNAEIYFFCRSGRRSGIITALLVSKGFTNVFNVSGGILAWQKAGYELTSGALDK